MQRGQVEGVLGARWLLRGKKKVGKATRPAVILTSLDVVELEDRIKFRGR